MPRTSTSQPKKINTPSIVPAHPNSKYPWEQMMLDYVEGIEVNGQTIYPTVSEIALKYKVPGPQAANRATKHRWVDHRTAHQAEIANTRKKEAVKRLAGKAVKFDEQSLDVAETGMSVVQGRLQTILRVMSEGMDPASFEQLEAKVNAGQTLSTRDFQGAVYYKEIEALAKAGIAFQQLGRTSLGIKDGENSAVNQVNIEVVNNNVTKELARPDMERARQIVSVLGRRGANLNMELTQGDDDDTEVEPLEIESDIPIYDAEIVSREDDEDE